METRQDLEAKSAELYAKAEESFERCDTDGFMSQWAHTINAQKAQMEAELVDDNMVAFPALFDLDGNLVNAKLISGRFGACWAICDDAGKFTGEFVSAFPKREATMVKKGYREGTEMAAARVKLVGSDCATVRPVYVRIDGR
jgi:hypothetical protein